MKRWVQVLGFLLIYPALLVAQEENHGYVAIYQDSRINSLIEKHIFINEHFLLNKENHAIEGYRLQIFFESGNNSSTQARQIKEEFEKKYKSVPAYITWKAPNFRVRVGDFRTRMEAEGFLQKIIQNYPNAWIIKDEINFPNLN
ncbi:MAG: SPOR domain-containing protein [Bacteroidetes bacterium]|nr:SPOR domain-containing protein [Bacteroidota bacterium]